MPENFFDERIASSYEAKWPHRLSRRPAARRDDLPLQRHSAHLGFEEYDIATQIAVSHHCWPADGRLETFSAPFRYVWPAELDLMARLAGLTLRERWSGRAATRSRARATATSRPGRSRAENETPMTDAQAGYTPIGDLSMYYEIHGAGRPLVLLHGAYMSVDMMGELVSGLAATQRVVAPEQQGHGRTADVDRPLTYERMADDTAALMRRLELEPADVVGYSMGGGIALQLAIRHPALVRRLVVVSASFRYDGMQPEAIAMFPSITPRCSPDRRSRRRT